MANILSSLLPSSASFPIPPKTLQLYLRSQPAYADNRERAAVVLDQGFKAYDGYMRAKPFIFAGALANAAFSGWMLKQRRKHGAETVTLWSTSLVVSLVAAFITRPGLSGAPPGSSMQQAADYGVVAAIDRRRTALRQRDPMFADKVFTRLTQLPGIKEPLDANPLVKAAIV
jgi:hypothetical protein